MNVSHEPATSKRSPGAKTGVPRGFTLVEVLIVVVILAILAAVIIPQATDSTEDAQRNTMLFNKKCFEQAIERYKAEHGGKLPSPLDFLYYTTNAAGGQGSGPGYIYGPYLDKTNPVVNPLVDKSTIYNLAGPLLQKPTSATYPSCGWVYEYKTGVVWPVVP